MNNELDLLFMAEAIKEAKLAYKEREVPVGAVIVIDNKIVARGRNTRIKDNLVTS
ncbi:MAG: tRNA-specific adenosine deaminase, partial [Gammaproteobacteria bacterium]|nr:tRNA-specific adenosine deaminase [Gammaproteobacteria bacterium]